MIKPRCNRCKEELHRPGALFFGPEVEGVCEKAHICIKCVDFVSKVVYGEEGGETPAQRVIRLRTTQITHFSDDDLDFYIENENLAECREFAIRARSKRRESA